MYVFSSYESSLFALFGWSSIKSFQLFQRRFHTHRQPTESNQENENSLVFQSTVSVDDPISALSASKLRLICDSLNGIATAADEYQLIFAAFSPVSHGFDVNTLFDVQSGSHLLSLPQCQSLLNTVPWIPPKMDSCESENTNKKNWNQWKLKCNSG